MRGIPLLIALMLIISLLPPALGKSVTEPKQRDAFLYQYFSQVLVRFDYSLRYALQGEDYSIALANSTLQELEEIREEALYYQERGVNSKVMEVIPPFYDFARKLVTLDTLVLKGNLSAVSSGILSLVSKMERDLDAIGSINLMNGSRVLSFNTGDVEKRLEQIKELASRTRLPNRLVVNVSEENPILNQTVTIFGSCPKNGSVVLVVEGKNTSILPLTTRKGLFTTSYRFTSLGVYRIYALQGGERSNVVTVHVGKIPSMFIVDGHYSALVGQTIRITGRLVDYYGRPLGDRNITVGNSSLATQKNGTFSVEYSSKRPLSFTIVLRFSGDSTHDGSTKRIEVTFLKRPVSLEIKGPERVRLGEGIKIEGKVSPGFLSPVIVYINNSEYSRLFPENGQFSVEINPSKVGIIKVCARFPGNEEYGEATSNVLVIRVYKPESRLPRYLAVVVGLSLLGGTLLTRKRKSQEKNVGMPPQEPEDYGEEPLPDDIGKAYALVRKLLKEKFGIGESLTPWEAVERLEDPELRKKLETITRLHEREVYGDIKLGKEEIELFRKTVGELMGRLKE